MTSEHILEERVQDSSAARAVRNREKTTLNLKSPRVDLDKYQARSSPYVCEEMIEG